MDKHFTDRAIVITGYAQPAYIYIRAEIFECQGEDPSMANNYDATV
jgi:hypothetical protein